MVRISLTRLATKVFHGDGWMLNQAKVTRKSDQQTISSADDGKICTILLRSRVSRSGTQSSSRGTLMVLMGATFVLATRSVEHGFELYGALSK